MGEPTIRPHERTGARLEPAELRRWLDEGRDFTLIDTRNQYEVEVGTFEGARDLGVDSFREFARRYARASEVWRSPGRQLRLMANAAL